MKNKNHTTIVLLTTVLIAGAFLILKNIGDKPQTYDARANNIVITPSPTTEPIRSAGDLDKALEAARQINPDELATENEQIMGKISGK